MIKEAIINYRIRKFEAKNTLGRDTVNYSSALKVGIVYNSQIPEREQKIRSFLTILENEGKQIETCEFIGKKKPEEQESLVYSQKDVSLLGKWKSTELNEFINTSFDYLINLEQESNRYIDYIFAASKAKCRIGGATHDGKSPYELIISLSEREGFDKFLKEIHRYLKIINKNES